ncbi:MULTISPECIES: ferredoxin:protochlorophyllide reductase (ATP-dependent) subunit B [unclassified Leptolyngbya]|uniref:ferredoxin:protochlorophyllide reductase (ATP-dependent) subunit B n=1 Tax=unclassified Leptolyngbya TaxID=2650499 RepID=UPI0016866808|nr:MULTISPECIES: ferredoxin:protochlorophyllide reductase (ATP-dependent) subunit B [unclassified Leptolyngbya]MBD1910884.1 ferredoxin:protochlorophyllide reductase (ATP-dependent) subunit B [Leptolyngbya sp. FACHB-8]MBD2153721.1 ferredoxin:protochlorophyllide reductase (ATP-dependent) subunit B [Leptolyngbya sp. FACHB-16]
MKLAYWMYAGPAHIGTLRIASSFKNVHAIMHAPLGDDYFNVMRSMLERERDFTPVTTSVVDRNVLARGSQEKVVDNITRKDQEEAPDLIVLTPTCTSSILQEDLQNFVDRAQMDAKGDVMLADVNHYRVNELQAADRTLQQIVQFYIEKARKKGELPEGKTERPSVNIIGISTLGFHNNHDRRELITLMRDLGIEINAIIPDAASVHELKHLPRAWFNLVPYRELGHMTTDYLQQEFGMPSVDITPMGIVETARCIRAIQKVLNEQGATKDYESYIDEQTRFVSQAAWFSRSIDCQNLTGKRAVVFGDNTHAVAMTRILAREMGIKVVLAGTYCKYDAEWFREQVEGYCDEVLVSDDNAAIANAIARLEPAAIFGTQMERHVGKRLDIPCGVIASPVHIQNFPVGFTPFLGYEGANQVVDLVYNSFTLGMEDHLLEIFGGHDTKEVITKEMSETTDLAWSKDGLVELNKIPGFVRGKVKRNVEKFARDRHIAQITAEVLYAAKEAVGA